MTLPALPLAENVVAASPSGDGLAVLTTPQDVVQPPHVLMVSSDHGRSWEHVVTNPHLVFRAIEMDDAGNAYALGDVYLTFDSQRLMSSRDGGRTWTFVPVPGGGMIIDMDVLPGGAVVIARNIEQGGGCSGGLSRGEVLVSADGRAPWRAVGPIAEYVTRSTPSRPRRGLRTRTDPRRSLPAWRSRRATRVSAVRDPAVSARTGGR